MIELMVALGVTLIMVAFFLNFSTNALSQWNRAAGRMTTENEASRVLDSLDQDLSTAVFRTDGRVWLAATIQPDQDQTGDTHGVSFSNSGSTTGQTRNFTSWTPGPRGNMKPKGMSSPYVPNAPGSSLVMPGYIPPATATQSTLTRSDTTAASNVPDITTFRFGQAGVWLRLFAPVPDSNNGQTKSAPVPRAIGYQIVRMKTADSSLSYRYYLMRSTVRPFGDIVTSQARSTFATGYDFFQTFNHFSMAWGSGPANTYIGTVASETFHNVYAASVYAGSDTRWVIPAAGLRSVYQNNDNTTYNNVQKFPSTFYVGVDLEKCATTLFCGQSTRTSQAQLEITMATRSEERRVGKECRL